MSEPLKIRDPQAGVAWACPRCRAPLRCDGDELVCPSDNLCFSQEGGILRLLDPARAGELDAFIRGYSEQRAREGWGSPRPPDYYTSLPYKDASGEHPGLWKLRADHMRTLFMFLEGVFDAVERPVILDAGAGNCWLSYRLSGEGARPIALDVNDDPADGLGAARLYREHAGVEITAVQGELERLPIAGEQCHAVVINGSLHYAADPAGALREGWRVLRPRGSLVVMDSPVYRRAEAGQMMWREWEAGYRGRYGVDPSPLPGKGFFTYDEMRSAIASLRPRPRQQIFVPQFTGLHALLRAIKLRLRPKGTRRELATHPMWVLTKP